MGPERGVARERTHLGCVVVDLGEEESITGRRPWSSFYRARPQWTRWPSVLGWTPKTVEKWREVALEGIEHSMGQGF